MKTLLAEAVDLKESANRLQEQFERAKTSAQAGDYSGLIAILKDIIRFSTKAAQLDAAGYTMEILGPKVVEAYNVDPAKAEWPDHYEGQYVALKTQLNSLAAYRMTNAAALYATAQDDSAGYVEYKGALDAAIVSQFIALFDSITVLDLG